MIGCDKFRMITGRCTGSYLFLDRIFPAAEAVVPDVVNLESVCPQDLRGRTGQVLVDDELHEVSR
jgi:hypothetical protein